MAASSAFRPAQKREWDIEETVHYFAKGKSSCVMACERRLAVLRGTLPPGEQVGITPLLLRTDTGVKTQA